MRIATICRYLLGNRQAILTLSRDRWSVWIGLLFVLSAGFAREYDQEYLPAQPWVLLLPLAASLTASFLLFQLVYFAVKNKGQLPLPYWQAYRSFLGLFWMTAPLAWLYAIPLERFMSTFGATQANLILLGVVSLWRVALMTHVISILTGCGWIQVLFRVMLFGTIVTIVATSMMPVPIISVMGGIPYSQTERLVRSTANNIVFLGIVTLPIWLIGVLIFSRLKETWTSSWDSQIESVGPDISVWGLVGCSLVAWIPILPFTQGEQRLRYEVERAYQDGDLNKSLALMSTCQRDDFPPVWDPPPRPAYRDPIQDLLHATEFIFRDQTPDWMREAYEAKFRTAFRKSSSWTIGRLSGDELDRFIELLDRLPNTDALRKANQFTIDRMREEMGQNEEEDKVGN